MTVNKSIQEKANDIRTKRYGSEVRESLASGLEVVGEIADESNDRNKSTENRQTKVESDLKTLQREYTENGNGSQTSAEITLARDGELALSDRLSRDFGNINEQLTQTDERTKYTEQRIVKNDTLLYEKTDRVDFNDLKKQVQQKADQGELDTVSSRIDKLVANAGNTDGNAELLDIRIGFDGTSYPTAGEAVRAIGDYLTEQNENWGI